MLDGAELTRISFIGQVRNIAKSATNTTYKLDDGTGTLEVKDWKDTDQTGFDEEGGALPASPDTIQVGDWIKATGNVKFHQKRRMISSQTMNKIKDMNQISFHLLECTYVHLFLTRGPPETTRKEENNATDQSGGDNMNVDMSGVHLQGVSMNARKIYNCLKKAGQSNEGLHISAISSETGLGPNEAQKAATELLDRSLIFTTIDDETYVILEY
jgi:replication factor A2